MIQAYLNNLRSRGRSPETIETYRNALKRFFHRVQKGWRKIAREDVVWYIKDLTEHVSLNSVATYVAPIAGFYKWLVAEGYFARNPVAGVPIPRAREPQLSEKISSIPDRARVIASVKGNDFRALRDRALLETGCAFGARVSDLVRLNVSNVDLRRAEVALRGKGDQPAVLPLTEAAVQRLQEYLPAREKVVRKGEEAVFVNCNGGRLTRESIWRIVKKYTDPLLPPEKAAPHAFFRHSTARQLVDAGAPLTDIQALLRHRKLTTTQLYTKATGSSLRRLVEQYHPRAVV